MKVPKIPKIVVITVALMIIVIAASLAGVKSKDAAKAESFDVIVAGGPEYAGKVGNSAYTYLDGLDAYENVKIGAFATGNYPTEDKVDKVFPDAATFDAVLMLFPEDNADKGCAYFVTGLLR